MTLLCDKNTKKPTSERNGKPVMGKKSNHETKAVSNSNSGKNRTIESSNAKNVGKTEDPNVRLKLVNLLPRDNGQKTSAGVHDLIKNVSYFLEKKNPFKRCGIPTAVEGKTTADLVLRGVSLRDQLQGSDSSNNSNANNDDGGDNSSDDRENALGPSKESSTAEERPPFSASTKTINLVENSNFPESSRSTVKSASPRKSPASVGSSEVSENQRRFRNKKPEGECDAGGRSRFFNAGGKDIGERQQTKSKTTVRRYQGRMCGDATAAEGKNNEAKSGQTKTTGSAGKRTKPSEIPLRKTRPDVTNEVQCTVLSEERFVAVAVEPDQQYHVESSPKEQTQEVEPSGQVSIESVTTEDVETNGKKHSNIPLMHSTSNMSDQCFSRARKLDLDKVKSSCFVDVVSSESIQKLENYHKQTIATKEATFCERVASCSSIKLKQVPSKTSSSVQKSIKNFLSDVVANASKTALEGRPGSAKRISRGSSDRQKNCQNPNRVTELKSQAVHEVRSKTPPSSTIRPDRTCNSFKSPGTRQDKPPTGRPTKSSSQQNEETAEKSPRFGRRTVYRGSSPLNPQPLPPDSLSDQTVVVDPCSLPSSARSSDHKFRETKNTRSHVSKTTKTPPPTPQRVPQGGKDRTADGTEDIKAAYAFMRSFYHKDQVSGPRGTHAVKPQKLESCGNKNDDDNRPVQTTQKQTIHNNNEERQRQSLTETEKLKVEIKIDLEPENEREKDQSQEVEKRFGDDSDSTSRFELNDDFEGNVAEDNLNDNLNDSNLNDLILDEETDREWKRVRDCGTPTENLETDSPPSPESTQLKAYKSSSSIRKKTKNKASLTRMMKARPKKKNINTESGNHLLLPGSGRFNSVTSFKSKIKKIKPDSKVRSGLTRALTQEGAIDGDLNYSSEEVAAINLKRRNSEPNSFRGFIWKQPELAIFRGDKASVSSLASSLRHMNADDLEDFRVWEAAPLKMTSCWEMSLYHCRSVLSCSIFKDNRLPTTPGVILENLRSGGTIDFSGSLFSDKRRPGPHALNAYDIEPSIDQKNIDIGKWLALSFPLPTSSSSDALPEGTFCTPVPVSPSNKREVSPRRRKTLRSINYLEESSKRKFEDSRCFTPDNAGSDLLDLIRRKSGGFVTADRCGQQQQTTGSRHVQHAIPENLADIRQEPPETDAADLAGFKTTIDGPRLSSGREEDKFDEADSPELKKRSNSSPKLIPEEECHLPVPVPTKEPHCKRGGERGGLGCKLIGFFRGESDINVWKYLFMLLLSLFIYNFLNQRMIAINSSSPGVRHF